MKIVIGLDGSVRSIAGGFKPVGGTLTRRRASHVEPASRILRLAFHKTRAIGSDRVDRWTRGWPCRWRVNVIGGPILRGTWGDRGMALAAEVLWLEKNNLPGRK